MSVKRSCYLCRSKYSFCDCDRQPSYMATFCSENCRDIFKSLCSYGSGMISAEECKELLECCDLSKQDSYKESTRNTIAKVFASSEPVIEVQPEPAAEDAKAEKPITPDVIEADPIPEPVEVPERKRKRNYEVVDE